MSTTRKAPEPTPPEPWTPERRSLNARYAAHALHAQVADESAHTAPARAAFMGRFEREVDPDGVLSPEDRERRARHARKATDENAVVGEAVDAARAEGGESVPWETLQADLDLDLKLTRRQPWIVRTLV